MMFFYSNNFCIPHPVAVNTKNSNKNSTNLFMSHVVNKNKAAETATTIKVAVESAIIITTTTTTRTTTILLWWFWLCLWNMISFHFAKKRQNKTTILKREEQVPATATGGVMVGRTSREQWNQKKIIHSFIVQKHCFELLVVDRYLLFCFSVLVGGVGIVCVLACCYSCQQHNQSNKWDSGWQFLFVYVFFFSSFDFLSFFTIRVRIHYFAWLN